ncbi:MAG: hypothetical protein GY868_12710, partial [Deltaproteobacteria bacterium]|nr:hypothetical protein [Deltaproteobacteria bacterium]
MIKTFHPTRRTCLTALLMFICACIQQPAAVKKAPSVPDQKPVPKVLYQKAPRWRFLGRIGPGTPNAFRVLKRYTGNVRAAMTIIEKNTGK